MGSGDAKALADRRQGRRWRFGDAVFDEGSWTLVIAGRRIPLEAKPMLLLHELLLQAGNVVTKDELLDRVWPGLSVVEASLPTAIRKLRQALGSASDEEGFIETIPRVGYRLAIPVRVEASPLNLTPRIGPPAVPYPLPARMGGRVKAWVGASLSLILVLLAVGGYAASGMASSAQPPSAASPVTSTEALLALRSLDVDQLRALMARGWDPNAPQFGDRNTATNMALEVCEWNPAHDREKLMLVVRMFLDSGERLDAYNAHGDTPYSIAKADRYCGPDHPVTRMLHALCYSGSGAPGDKCLATYERERGLTVG